jgi:hypothetical protein
MVRIPLLVPALLFAGLPLFAGAALAGPGGHGAGGHGSGIAAHGAAGYGPNSPGIAAHGFNGRVGGGGGWHGGHHRQRFLSGMMSNGNATQAPVAPPAIYKVEASGRHGKRAGHAPSGQFRQLFGTQAFQPAGIRTVSGSSFGVPPRVFVVKVPRG